MKRIEKALEIKGRFSSSAIMIIQNNCPDDMYEDLEGMDCSTAKFGSSIDECGCRGITCEECWNKELD